MNKIEVEICCGTACYLLGAARLMELGNNLPEDIRDSVVITPKSCLKECENEQLGGAPYVRIDGELMAQATVNKIEAKIREIVSSRQS